MANYSLSLIPPTPLPLILTGTPRPVKVKLSRKDILQDLAFLRKANQNMEKAKAAMKTSQAAAEAATISGPTVAAREEPATGANRKRKQLDESGDCGGGDGAMPVPAYGGGGTKISSFTGGGSCTASSRLGPLLKYHSGSPARNRSVTGGAARCVGFGERGDVVGGIGVANVNGGVVGGGGWATAWSSNRFKVAGKMGGGSHGGRNSMDNSISRDGDDGNGKGECIGPRGFSRKRGWSGSGDDCDVDMKYCAGGAVGGGEDVGGRGDGTLGCAGGRGSGEHDISMNKRARIGGKRRFELYVKKCRKTGGSACICTVKQRLPYARFVKHRIGRHPL